MTNKLIENYFTGPKNNTLFNLKMENIVVLLQLGIYLSFDDPMHCFDYVPCAPWKNESFINK